MRQKIVIGSKILPDHCKEEDVEKHCDASLARLGMTCIDLYMIHWPVMVDGKPNTEGTFRALKKL
jgi:diketogulonate reductase-like aldo/keto reductase